MATMGPGRSGLVQGDTALVTGAAGGIGRGIAAALADEGATVFGADLKAGQTMLVRELARAPRADKIALRRFGNWIDP